jgi:GNAT superfamily N-acetyltransferase
MPSSAVETSVVDDVVGREIRGTITASIAGAEVGHLAFVDYSGVTQIRDIFTAPDRRRQGVARAMVDALRKRFPASVPPPGGYYTNPAGAALEDALLPIFAAPLEPAGDPDATDRST